MERRLTEVEHENEKLRKVIASDSVDISTNAILNSITTPSAQTPPISLDVRSEMNHPDEAVVSLMQMKTGVERSVACNAAPGQRGVRVLENVVLPADCIHDLFQEYFRHYHEILPLLNRGLSADHCYELSPLLFWTIATVASRRFRRDEMLLESLSKPLMHLVWATVSTVPQDYHAVKALCLLCTWPLPTSRSSTDSTFMLAGVMLQIAAQVGLHRPSHAQDFSRRKVNLKQEDIEDRARTWTTCLVVAQTYVSGSVYTSLTLSNLPKS